MNEFTLLRVCRDIKDHSVTNDEIKHLVKDVSTRTLSFPKTNNFTSSADFLVNTASQFSLDKSFFTRAYPQGDYPYFSKAMQDYIEEDEISEEDEVQKSVYLDFSDTQTSELLNLSKAAPSGGMTTKGSIKDAIDEYERLYKAGFSTSAEILTLSRYYPKNKVYAQLAGDVLENGEPMVVGGPASVEMVDREGHLITMDAMDRAFRKFMGNIRTRNAMVLHSDVQVGWALPAYINKAGQIFKSGVFENHLFFITEMRNDTKIADRVKEQVKEGRIRSYSIAGSALNTDSELIQEKGKDKIVTKVTELELAEVTVCEKGVNEGAHFNLLKAHGSEKSGTCIDGSCLISIEKEQAGPGSGVASGGVTGGNYNKFYGGFDPDKDLPNAGKTVEEYSLSMDNNTQGSMSPGLESTSEYNEDKVEEVIEYDEELNKRLQEVFKMVTGKSSSLERLKSFVKAEVGPKGTLTDIYDTPEEIIEETEKIREKYGWPKEKEALNELKDMKNNPESRGTTQRGTAVTTSGEDYQTLDINKSEDCGCN